MAATYGPGLASSLLIGLNAGKGIAFAAVMGTIGGLLPARLASRTLIVRALRTEV